MRSDYLIDRRTLPFYVVEFVAEGEGTVVLDGREHPLGPGVAFAYRPREHHVIRNHEGRPMLKYFAGFVGSGPARLLRATRVGHGQPVRVRSIGEVAEMFELMLREAVHGDNESRRLCNALVIALLLKIEQAAQPTGRAKPGSLASYERIRRYIEAHQRELRTIEEVADACRVSPAYVSRLFRRFARLGAYQFLMRLKMNRAAEMLYDGGSMIKEVAADLGFADAFHFSRVFKRTYGVAPDDFAHHGDAPSPRAKRRRPPASSDARSAPGAAAPAMATATRWRLGT
jgi:AraC-like DNA-binding protein